MFCRLRLLREFRWRALSSSSSELSSSSATVRPEMKGSWKGEGEEGGEGYTPLRRGSRRHSIRAPGVGPARDILGGCRGMRPKSARWRFPSEKCPKKRGERSFRPLGGSEGRTFLLERGRGGRVGKGRQPCSLQRRVQGEERGEQWGGKGLSSVCLHAGR